MKYAYEWAPKWEPIITDESIEETRSLIGIPLRRRHFNNEASRIAIVTFARNIGDRNPLYLGEEYGIGTKWGCMIAPPTWLYSVDDTVIAPKLRGIHTLYAGAKWEFYRPVRLGDKITPEACLVDVQEKKGEFCGRMVMQIGQVIYRNQGGEDIAKVRSKVMRCPRGEAKKRGKYMGIKKHRYSSEEVMAIEEGYDAENIRGADIRYWEDVAIGEEFTTVVKGPLTAEDVLLFVNITRPIQPFALAYQHRLRHPADFYHNPETGLPDFSMACLIDDAMAQQCGFPYAHDHGTQRVSWMANLLTNWIGDDGWLKMLNVEIRRPDIYGDTTWCKGKVLDKELQGEEHIVRLQVWAENQRGEVTAQGEATATLLSRMLKT